MYRLARILSICDFESASKSQCWMANLSAGVRSSQRAVCSIAQRARMRGMCLSEAARLIAWAPRKSLRRNVRQSASARRPHGRLVVWMRGCRQAGTFRKPPRQIRIPREAGPLWSSSKSPRDYMPQLGGCELALKVITPIPKALLLGQASGFRRSRRTPAAAAFPRHVARPAKHRPVTSRLERHSRRLAATRTNHRGSL